MKLFSKKKKEEEREKEVEVYSEKAESKSPDLTEDEIKALASAYAKYLKDHELAPGDASFVEPEDLGLEIDFDAEEEPKDAEKDAEEVAEEEKKEENEEKIEDLEDKKEETVEATEEKEESEEKDKKEKKPRKNIAAAIIDLHDRIQDRTDETFIGMGRGIATFTHNVADGYRHSRRSIGFAALAIMLLASLMLVVFDRITVYEYAYNGKVLGYVSEQEEVMDVLEIAGKKLTENNNSIAGVEFVANQNISFNLVDGRGKSTDDSDTAVNKLIYMTDIETEAAAIFDDGKMVAIVRDEDAAEALLEETLNTLGEPDSGMELVLREFIRDPEIRPVNVLLGSVQSSQKALKQMTKGGVMETFHIVEEGEDLNSIAEAFGSDVSEIYDENNEEIATEAVQGERVCIRTNAEPVSVRVVEDGKLKIVEEFKTIKKESDEYYQGDSFVEQEGKNGIVLFEGRVEKENGEIVSKDGEETEVRERKDKIIVVGTAERPKTAPTGTFAMPIVGRSVTSEFGPRWGRNHDGLDFGAPTGTTIYASDGGTVVRAGTHSGYGLVVEIDHENGRLTRYAHCSKLLVSAGDKVYQGQEIALVGNTGRSFGSHLHFEIHMNGSPVNPRPYLGI